MSYTPIFPYKGNQVLISSDRIHLLSKNDGIFLMGNKTVSLSSPMTINLDSNTKVLINSPKIELGEFAENKGQQVILGNELIRQLKSYISKIKSVGDTLKTVAESDVASLSTKLKISGEILSNESQKIINELDNTLSTVTYTR
jgi:hypothetical protein